MAIVIFSESHSFLSYFVVILTDVLPQKLLQPGLAQHPDALPRRSPAATPQPAVSVPENVPSYTAPEPQEGLRSLRTAASAPVSRASSSTASAPAGTPPSRRPPPG